MRVAVVADIGQPVYHVGDEAIGHAAHAELSRRGLHPVMFTRCREDTQRHYGDVETAPTLEFPRSPTGRLTRLHSLSSLADGGARALPNHGQAQEVVEALRSCDALLVAGGGNLNSRFGWLLYERAGFAMIARSLGIPVVLTGQTLGPQLTQSDRTVARDLLHRCDLVGLRDSRSIDLAFDLGIAPESVVPVLDDATFLESSPQGGTSAGVAPRTAITATISLDTGPLPRSIVIPRLASLLDAMADLVGEPVRFVPHMATPGVGDGDEDMHRRIASLMRPDNADLLPIEPARKAIERSRHTQLTITTRFHPAVFAAASGSDVLCLAPDDYSAARMTGAMTQWGFDASAVLPLACVVDDDLLPSAITLWRERGRHELAARRIAEWHREFEQRWWDAVAAHLKGVDSDLPTLCYPEGRDPVPDLSRLARRHAWYLPMTQALTRSRLELSQLRSRETALSSQLAEAQRGAEDIHLRLQESRQREEAIREERDAILTTRAFRFARAVWSTRTRLARATTKVTGSG